MEAAMSRFFGGVKGGEHRPPTPAVRKTGGKAPDGPVPTPSDKAKKKEKGRREAVEQATGKQGTGKTSARPGDRKPEEPTWAKVVGRRERRVENKARNPPPPTAVEQARRGKGTTTPPQGPAKAPKKRKVRTPTTSAVTITCPKGGYAEVMAEVRRSVPLATVGLSQKEVSVRRGATGSTVVEIRGEEREAKADALATAIRLHLAGSGSNVKVGRPIKTADVRVTGLEVSLGVAEVAEAVAEKAGCAVSEIKTGETRTAPGGLLSLWMRLPVTAAKKAAEGGTLHVGWSKAKIGLLEARPLRCFKCLERGHTQATCESGVDRSGSCYRCGGTGHIARSCIALPKCPLCAGLGRKASHALGAPECAPQGRRRGGAGRVAAVNTAGSPKPPPTKGEAAATTTAPTPKSAQPLRTSKSSVGLPPAEEGEAPKPQRSKARRRTTRPLEDSEESEELERAVAAGAASMEVDTEVDTEEEGTKRKQ